MAFTLQVSATSIDSQPSFAGKALGACSTPDMTLGVEASRCGLCPGPLRGPDRADSGTETPCGVKVALICHCSVAAQRWGGKSLTSMKDCVCVEGNVSY